jgi:hypothetical protein
VVVSNERSASSGNLVWRGREVNHQWSKGLDAEALLRDALSGHAGLNNACFSLLRGMSELHIAQLFSATNTYDGKVTSCNHAFRMGSTASSGGAMTARNVASSSWRWLRSWTAAA